MLLLLQLSLLLLLFWAVPPYIAPPPPTCLIHYSTEGGKQASAIFSRPEIDCARNSSKHLGSFWTSLALGRFWNSAVKDWPWLHKERESWGI